MLYICDTLWLRII